MHTYGVNIIVAYQKAQPAFVSTSRVTRLTYAYLGYMFSRQATMEHGARKRTQGRAMKRAIARRACLKEGGRGGRAGMYHYSELL